MPFLIAFAGWHNSGKTTVAVQVAGHLHALGYRIGVIKSSKDANLAPERQHSDTSRYSEAGAKRVALAAPDVLIVRESETRQNPVALARSLFADMDIVLVEGFKRARGLAKIEVRRAEIEEPALRSGEAGDEVIALVCENCEKDPGQTSLPCFHPADIPGIARFILALREEHLHTPACTLLVNGNEHPLPPIVQTGLLKLLVDSHCPQISSEDGAPLRIDLHCRLAAARKP